LRYFFDIFMWSGSFVTDTGGFSGYEALAGEGFLKASVAVPSFRARFPWYGGDLQTIRHRLPFAAPVGEIKPERIIHLPLDNQAGESLAAVLNRPGDDALRPLVVLVHGLGGTYESSYMVAAVKYFLSKGHACLRVNLRGAGLSAGTSAGIYSAGVSDDLAGALNNLEESLTSEGVWLMGFSLGANVVLKYMGEGKASDAVKGALAVSPPLDLLKVQLRLNQLRNRLYRRYLMTNLRATFDGANWGRRGAPVASSGAIKSIIQFDEKIVAPWHGFDGAHDYYEKCSGGRFLQFIDKPCLIMHARTDPWIPATIYRDQGWPGQDKFCVLLSDDGGHVGFHDSASEIPWHLRVAEKFITALE
jgi:uncharacterized protein